MKALVITGSRADRNGLEEVYIALNEAGHKAALVPYHCMGPGTAVMRDGEVYSAANVAAKLEPDVVIAGGDRLEMLKMVVAFAGLGLPIAHIAGGDVTEGSADDRYRDAITALSCVHFATNEKALSRLNELTRQRRGGDLDLVYLTGSPAIDRIKQTPINRDRSDVLSQFCMQDDKPTVLVCVHPNTLGPDPLVEARAVCAALSQIGMQCICLGANADAGGEQVNAMWRNWCDAAVRRSLGIQRMFCENVSPQLYYSLMTHCDVMVGNSSAMLYEAPSFGLPCVMVGNRQFGRIFPDNVVSRVTITPDGIVRGIEKALQRGRIKCENPYGDGDSAPRIVKALEENSWRWSSKERGEHERRETKKGGFTEGVAHP